MKSLSSIKMDFQEALRDADRVESIANRMQNLADGAFEDSMAGLASAWTGENSTQFLRKEGQIQKEIRTNARTLQSIAEDIRTVARQVYEAERRAYYIALRRNS